MKSTPTLRFSIQRLFLLTLVSFVAVAAVLGIAASANKANRAAKALQARQAQATQLTKAAATKSVVIRNSDGQKPLAPNATAITATLDDNVPAATKVAPGGTINYTAVIKNTGTAGTDDAGSVTYSHTLDSNTTLVPGSVHASPIAFNNSYTTAIGNTLLEVGIAGGSTAPKVTVAGTLFDNDTIATAPDTIQLSSFTAASANAGTVSVNANGSFTYLPAAGFTGTDTFTYTIRNSADATLTDTATVTITVNAPRVWYVDNSGANGDGRSTSPFNTLANAAAVDGIGDIIYIFTGGGNYTGGIALANNELVIGNGVALVVNTITLRAAGARPTVVNGAGVGMTLAQNNTLTGFNFGASTGFSITGASVGTLTVNNMLINNTTGGALDLTGVSTPTVSVVLDSTTSTGGTKNVNLVGLNGTITLASGALSAASGNAFDVSGGAATITYTGTVTNTAAARLINIANMTGGGASFSGALSGTSSSTGINLTTNTGATFTFNGGVVLSTAGNTAFNATGGGTVNVCDENPCVPGATGGLVNTLTTTTGTALNVTSTNIGANNLEFRSINSPTASANSGIVLNTTGSAGGLKIVGTGGAGTGGTISNKSVTGISLTSTAKVILTSMNITGNGDQIDENGIRGIDVTGTSSFTGLSVTTSFHANVWLESTSAASTLTMTVTGSTFNSSITHDGFHAVADLGSMTLTMSNNNFNSNFSDGLDAGIPSNSSTAATLSDVSVTTSSFNNNGANGILIFGGGSGDSHFNIFSNTSISGNPSNGVNLFQNNGTLSGGKLRGKLNGNTITETTINGGGTCAILNAQGAGTATVEITNNICNYNRGSNTGIVIQSGDGGPGSTIVKFTGNTINMAGIDLPLGAINIESGLTAASTRTICWNAGVVGAADDTIVNLDAAAIANGVFKLRLRKRPNSFFNIQGITPNPSTTLAQVQNYVSSVTGIPAADILVSGPATYQINYTDATCSTAASIPNDAVSQKAEPRATTTTPALATNAQLQSPAAFVSSQAPALAAAAQPSSNKSSAVLSHHAVRNNSRPSGDSPNAPLVTVSVALGTLPALPAGKVVTIKYAVTVNTPPLARQISAQGAVTFNGNPGGSVNTTDFSPPNGPNTVTLIDTAITWTGAVDTNWNTPGNWTVPGPPVTVATYAPGVTNPAVNEVTIPAVANQPTIPSGGGDISIYSLSLANTMTLTIGTGRILTIGGSPGGDLALNGVITGGELRFGTGTHNITNTGTGSLSSTNLATVLSGSIVTLGANLQAGALAINSGGSMDISGGGGRLLSLNGTGGLAVAGGGTLTTTGSTVTFNGTAAQQAAGIAYHNLTINNTIGANVTGVTLTGNAIVNGTLTLTSSDLATSTFTLTQPNTTPTAPGGVSDVVGTVIRTGGPFALATPLTFGNPNNIVTFTAGTQRPTTLTVVLAKTAPATYAAAVTRNYTISQTGTNNATATLRLRYLDPSELNGNVEANLHLRRLRPGDGHWVAQVPDSVNTANNYVESSTVAATDLPTQWTFSSLVPTAAGGVVTGRIVDNSGNPVEGAVVRLSGTQNRKFITDANGFYRFDNVETTGFYTVTPSRVNYTFSPSSRSFSQIGETTEAAFGATATGQNANPLDTPEYFVRQHYLDFLGREPDEAGFNFWSDEILGCGNDNQCIDRKRENVSAAYFLSIEFQKTGGLVDGLYRSAYGVRPDFGQFMPDTRSVGLGVQVGKEGWEAKLAANKEAFMNAFVNRAAFHAQYDGMDNSTFVNTLIGHTGVTFSSGERDALVSGLSTGTMTRAEALRSIAENNRFVDAKFNEAFVMMEYFGYLRRDPDSSGFAYWLAKLNQFGGNFEQAEMVRAFIVSGEYRDRFPR